MWFEVFNFLFKYFFAIVRSERLSFKAASFNSRWVRQTKICILEHLSRLIDFGIQECNFCDGSFSCKFDRGVVI